MWPLLLLSCITARYVDPGEQEEECVAEDWYRDSDGDGHGDPAFTTQDCVPPDGWVGRDDDCDDGNPYYFEDCPGDDCTLLGEFEQVPEADSGLADTAQETSTRLYYACTESVGWQSARQKCQSAFVDLAAAGGDGEFEALTGAAHRMGLGTEEGWWVGLYQENTAPSVDFGWFWVQGEGWPPSGTLEEGGIWQPEQPDNGGESENTAGAAEEDVAALTFASEEWGIVDHHTSLELPYICEASLQR